MKQTSLLERQILFWEALVSPSHSLHEIIKPIAELSVEQSVHIYKRGYKARLTEALGETFQACWWVLGDEVFLKIAGDYVAETYSKSYDLSDYGHDFSDFLRKTSDDIPFISDLALFEWNFKQIFHSQDILTDINQLKKSLESGTDFGIKIHPSSLLLSSKYSVYEIWKHRGKGVEIISNIDWHLPENLLLYKSQQKVHVLRLDLYEYDFLSLATAGRKTFHQLLEKLSSNHPELHARQIQSLFSRLSPTGVILTIA